jgi:hypothetical protein
MAVHTRIGNVLLGSIVTLVSAPTGIGPAVGGWIAGRRTGSPVAGGVAGAIAGLLGSLPMAALVFAAASGSIEPIGYHEGVVHIGVNTAAPGALVLWQELALSGLVLGVLVTAAVVGGIVAGVETDIVADIRADLANGA